LLLSSLALFLHKYTAQPGWLCSPLQSPSRGIDCPELNRCRNACIIALFYSGVLEPIPVGSEGIVHDDDQEDNLTRDEEMSNRTGTQVDSQTKDPVREYTSVN
jgi:hypothetical protein